MKRLRRPWPVLVLAALAGTAVLAALVAVPHRFVDAGPRATVDAQHIALDPGRRLGQTFVARHAGLAGIDLFLVPGAERPATLTLRLRSEPSSATDLEATSVTLEPDAPAGYVRFSFAPILGSNGRYYYAVVESAAAGIDAPLAGLRAYPDGAAYLDGAALEGQTSFRLAYAPGRIAADLAGTAARWAWGLAVSALLFVVPGLGLLVWLMPQRGSLDGVALLGLSIGVSAALYPLLMLWSHLAGLHAGPLYAWVPMAGGLVALGWRLSRHRPSGLRQRWHAAWRSPSLWPSLGLAAVLVVTLVTRLVVLGGLEAPLWGDGYQHTLISRLLVDRGGLFDSWAPYADLETFTYHFGFHSGVAAFHWLGGFPVVEATLWMGQLLNWAAVLCVYPLALRVTGSRWAGLWAVLLAGLLSPMPMEYVAWGRYTQLAGLCILPAAVWLTWELAADTQGRRGVLALASIAAAGLALTHYRVLLFYAAFLPGLVLLHLSRRRWKGLLARLAAVGLGVALLAWPWYLNTFRGQLDALLGYRLTTFPSQASTFDQQYNAVGDLGQYLAPGWWVALLLGQGVGLWQRRRPVLLVGLWWLGLLVATNPAWLFLPGTGVITNFALFISAYLPAGLLTAVLAEWLLRRLVALRWSGAMLLLLALCLALWGAVERLGRLDLGRTALVTRPDIQAAAWIRDNTPVESTFLVNSFFTYGDSSIVGSDAGWWLPLLAGRRTSVPPLPYTSEAGPGPDYRLQVNALAQMVGDRGPGDPAVLGELERRGITHAYVGQRQGSVNSNGEVPLRPAMLLASPHYRPVYHQDGVWVFEIQP